MAGTGVAVVGGATVEDEATVVGGASELVVVEDDVVVVAFVRCDPSLPHADAAAAKARTAIRLPNRRATFMLPILHALATARQGRLSFVAPPSGSGVRTVAGRRSDMHLRGAATKPAGSRPTRVSRRHKEGRE
jgi:hypothetical protein